MIGPPSSIFGLTAVAGVLSFVFNARSVTSIRLRSSNGFGRYSNTPICWVFTAVNNVDRALITITGKSGRRSLIRGNKSNASPSGRATSVINTSPRPDFNQFPKPSGITTGLHNISLTGKACWTTSRTDLSSSATRITGGLSLITLPRRWLGQNLALLENSSEKQFGQAPTQHQSSAPWSAMTLATMVKPRPLPPDRPDTKGSKIWSRNSFADPTAIVHNLNLNRCITATIYLRKCQSTPLRIRCF